MNTMGDVICFIKFYYGTNWRKLQNTKSHMWYTINYVKNYVEKCPEGYKL